MRKGVVSIRYGDAEAAAEENVETQNGNELFVDHRRGEVNDLYEKLQDITLIKDRERRIELFEKAIALMTLGVDVSSLYSLMILASATQDQVEKKIIYLYLTHYAERNSDLALLMVNTLRKDSEDEDPVIRSLALRSFSSLKIPVAMEYIEPILRAGLEDPVGYVRKTAVMGCLKFFRYSREDFLNSSLLEVLTSMLETELDPNAIINLVYVLNEMNKESRGALFTREFVLKVLGNIKSFNEWSQYHILQLIHQNLPTIVGQPESLVEYRVPPSDVFQVLNALEKVIRHSSANVLLASVQIFVSLTVSYPRLFSQVVQRIKGPLFTHASTSIPEISIMVYSHLRLLFSFFSRFSSSGEPLEEVSRGFYSSCSMLSHYFDEFKQLLLRNGDPYYIQDVKLDLIPFLSSEDNTEYILEELYHYSYELADPFLIHKSTYLMSLLVVKYIQIRQDSSTPSGGEADIMHDTLRNDHVIRVYTNLTKDLMESEKEEILSPVLMGLELLSESFPWAIEELVGRYFQESLVEKLTFRTGGICSFVWIMGKFPDYVYCDKAKVLDGIVTNLIETYEKNPSSIEDAVNRPSNLFNVILTSSCKLLFHSPEEMRPVLGKLLAFSIEKMDYPDVKDLALFYYRLLQFDYKVAKTIVLGDLGEDFPAKSVPSSVCILQDYFHRWRNDQLLEEFNTCSVVSKHYRQVGIKFDFFGRCKDGETRAAPQFEDPIGTENRKAIVLTSGNYSKRPLELKLKQSVFIDPDEFEQLWNKIEQNWEAHEELLKHQTPPFKDFEFMALLEDELSKRGVVSVASGQTDETSFKLFAFSLLEDSLNSVNFPCLSETTIHYSIPEKTYHVLSRLKLDTRDLTDVDISLYCSHVWLNIRDVFRSNL